MRLTQIYNENKLVLSFEVSPPRTQEGVENLMREMHKLKKYNPAFISVTYGAGGSTQGRSLQILERLTKEEDLTVMAHLTCIGSSPASIKKFLDIVKGWGVENILALRGDYPKNQPDYQPESNYFKHAIDLVNFTKKNTSLDVAVAGFPEKHPTAVSFEEDINHLKAKVQAGASVIITQLFFENKIFFDYLAKLKNKNINIPVIPGIWTLTSPNQIPKILECGATIPSNIISVMENKNISDAEKKEFGINYAVKQIKELIERNVQGIHLYTLNKAEVVTAVLDRL
jgi:methylenetetrahydrofolate reductase (NADPH)